MVLINGWKFDFKTMMAYRDKTNPIELTRMVRFDPLQGRDMIRISINYGIVFKYWPDSGPVESHFFDPHYHEIDYDSQILKAYTDWQFEQQILLK